MIEQAPAGRGVCDSASFRASGCNRNDDRQIELKRQPIARQSGMEDWKSCVFDCGLME